MWYFSWILGLGLAVMVAIVFGVWTEYRELQGGDTGLDD